MVRSDQQLCEAIGANDLDAARAALDAGAAPDPAMPVALANAFDHGIDAIALLVERGASPAAREHDFGTTPLMHLAGAGELAAVQALLDRGADAGAEDSERRTALDWALAAGCWRVARRLAEAAVPDPDADPDPDELEGPYRAPPSAPDRLARRGLAGAARAGRLDDLRAILDDAPALALDPAAMAEAWTCAAASAIESSGDRLAVLELIERRAAAPPWEHADRDRALTFQAVEGSPEAIRHVVSRLAPLRAGERALLIGCAAGAARDDVLPWLLAELPVSPAALGLGLLAAATRGSGTGAPGVRDATPAARLLLDAGAPTGACDPTGQTPLMQAAHRHDLPMLELLLAHGADVSARDFAGRTAMAWANHLPGWPPGSRKRDALDLLRRHGAADQRWTADPPLPARPPTAWDKLQVALFVLAVVGIVFAVTVHSCAGAE